MLRAWLLIALVLPACGDDDDAPPDATIPDATVPDVEVPVIDAAPPDAPGPCAGQLLFHGDYVEWDSTDLDFTGMCSADLVEVGNKTNTSETAPNGRGVLCLPPGADADVRYAGGAPSPNCTDDLALTMLFAVDADVAAIGPFTARGLTTARADTLIVDELGLGSRDVTDAIVIVDLGVTGGTVDIDATYEQSFVLPDGVRTLFANVDPTGGTTTATVTPPGGMICDGRATLTLQANAISFANYACE